VTDGERKEMERLLLLKSPTVPETARLKVLLALAEAHDAKMRMGPQEDKQLIGPREWK
jgi:hypothetical protein